MEKKFFIHGKPSSGESTGNNIFDGLGDCITDELFMSSQQMKTPCLKCEIRKWNQSSYSVFTYFRNGLDCYGSQNGFCALTLIVKDYYCIKVFSVYRLLEFIYKSGLQDTLHCINQDGKYLISSYKDVPLLSALSNDLFARLDDKLFRPIDQSFHSSIGMESHGQFNPIDADSEAFFSDFRENGIVIISPSFEPKSEKIIRLQHRLSELEEKNKNNPSITLPDYSAYIKQLEKENQSLKTALKHLQEQGVVNSNITGDRITKSMKPTDWMHYVNFALICVCLFGVFKCTPDEMPINSSESSETIDRCQSIDYVTLNQDLDSLKNIMNQIKALSSTQIKHSGPKNTIKKGTPVTLSLSIDSNDYDPKQLEWNIDVVSPADAEIKRDSLIGKRAGHVIVKCVYNGIIVNRRDIEITN